MGQKMSTADKYDLKREIYALYPGLEQQLEMAFYCHDIKQAGRLPYSTLEPVIRHLLLQYGLIEYVTRFSTNEGALDPYQVRAEMSEFGIGASSKLFGEYQMNQEDFKSLAVIWLKKILDTHSDDVAEWTEKLRKDQEAQSESYSKALSEFQEKYTLHQAMYQQGLQEQQKQIDEWNKLLEDTHKTQQEIYDSEVKRIQEVEEREANAAEEALREKQALIDQYRQKLEEIAKNDPNGKCFVYNASATPNGACTSAGAQEPCRRKKIKKEPRPQKGCC